jgi:phosphatidylinositol-4,5-bisphosphate 3-kinase
MRLESLDDDVLQLYLLQLTQVLKYEPFHDSALARFLLRRAILSPHLIGHAIFWLLKAEMHTDDVR